MKKKLLLILTVLVVVLMAATVMACTDYTTPTDEEDTTETVTRTQLITNGTFYDAKGSSTDSYIKQTVTGWTATKGSLATTANGVTMGVIDLENTEAYTLNKDKFSVVDKTDFVNPGVDPQTPKDTDEEGNEIDELQDTNVLIVANTETAGSVYYKNSSSYKLEKGKCYVLQYSVNSKVEAEENDDTKGAWVVLTGGVEHINSCINTNGAWRTYYIYIESNKDSTINIDLRLWLGHGPEKINGVENDYTTRGAVMFDNFICSEILTDVEEGAAKHEAFAALAGTNAANENAYDDNFVSAYYLSDLNLTQLNETYYTPSTTNAVKYFYSFREGSYSTNNSKNYTLVEGKEDLASADKPTVISALNGIVDLSKLYVVDQEDKTKDAYSAILDTYKFDAPTYDDWYNKIMVDRGGKDLSAAGAETKALMISHNDLSGAGLTNKSTFTVEQGVNYIVKVWAYVWAPYNSGTGVITYPTANKPTEPTAYSAAQEALRDFYNDETGVGGLFNKEYDDDFTAFDDTPYFDDLSAEEKAIVDGTAPTPTTAVTAVNTLVDTDEFINAVKAAYGNDVFSYFKFKYLLEHYDDYVDAGDEAKLKDTAADRSYIVYRYLTERSNFLKNTWPTVKTLMEKWDTYYADELAYNVKYTVWENNNDIPYAKVKLTGAGEDIVETTKKCNEGWEEITFYITGNQLSSRTLTLEFWFGEGSATEYENLMFGGVFFDDITILSDVDKADYVGAEWKVLSPLTDEAELEFGGLLEGEAVADHWTDALAEDVAQEDADSITLQYQANTYIGNVEIAGVPVTLQELVLTHGTPTASVLNGSDIFTVNKNTAYRIAIWAKTEIEDSDKGVTIELLGGEENDISKMSVLASVSSFNSDDWKEIVFYLLGDSQATNYVALRATMGSGTRYSVDSYVKGSLHMAVINTTKIKYSEYNSSSKSGDEVKSYAFSNTGTASDSVTNGNFSAIDYTKTNASDFNADGSLKNGTVAALSNWTVATAKNNTFNTVEIASDYVSGETYKISWAPVKGIDYNGDPTEPTYYEVYAKFAEGDEVVERLWNIVDAVNNVDANANAAFDNTENKYYVQVNLTGIKATSFRVRAVSDDAVSTFSNYVTPASATASGNVLVEEGNEPTAPIAKREIKAGSIPSTGLFTVDGSYKSAFNTVLEITSNYAVAQKVTASDKSLSSGSYYYISVWVRTEGDAKASVTVGNVSNVLTAERANNYIGYVGIDTDGKWVNYGFFVKTGNSSTSFGLELGLGNPYAIDSQKKISAGDSKTVPVYKDSDLSSGTVYFDTVKVLTVTEAEYKEAVEKYSAALAADEMLWVDDEYGYIDNKYTYQTLEYTTDSFDSFTENTASDNMGNTPNNYTWAKASDATGTSETERMYGVYNYSTDSLDKLKALYTTTDSDTGDKTNVFSNVLSLPENFDENAGIRDFVRINGYNSLVMSNKVAFGQNYTTSNTYTISSTSYYKISFKAKAWVAKEVKDGDDTTYSTDGVYAEFRFIQNSSTTDKYQSILINTKDSGYDAVEYVLYIKNPSSTSSSAKWSFYLGDNAETDSTGAHQLLLGMMVVDQVSMETIDEAAYNAAANEFNALTDEQKLKASTKVYAYDEDAESGDDEGDDDDDSGDDSGTKTSIWDRGDAWLLISSIVIAVVIVIVVVVVVIRRWKKKHPREVVVENNVNVDKNVKKVEPEQEAPVDLVDDETEEYSDVVEKPVYVQRVVRKDKKKKKK